MPCLLRLLPCRSDPTLQPYLGANAAAFLFWFAYITLVAFFVLNLYVGVVFYQFQRLKMMSQTGSAVLTASQTVSGRPECCAQGTRATKMQYREEPAKPILFQWSMSSVAGLNDHKALARQAAPTPCCLQGYVEMMKAVFRLKPLDKAPLPENRVRRCCHRLAYHPWFDHAMTAVIVANIVLLATTHWGESQGFSKGAEAALSS